MKRHYLSFVSNFKNENPYLKEWVEYHLSVGVDHLYLYDQCGSDESKEILAPFIAKGLITVHDWNNFSDKYDGRTFFFQKNKNHIAYMHAAKNYRKHTQWLLKIDLDEFLLNGHQEKTIREYLEELDYKKTKLVRVPRFDFGTNGHQKQPEGLVTENYLKREKSHSNYKDVANTHFLNDNNFCFSSHRWSFKPYRFGEIVEPTSSESIRINHYYTKSKDEYFSRQNISRGRKVSEQDFEIIENRISAVFDDSILNESKKTANTSS